jgi:hypothetical protein
MNLNILKPRIALNKAFLKVKPGRNAIDLFKENLISLIDNIDEVEHEEFHKIPLSNFFRSGFANYTQFISTKDSIDLVIHNGEDSNSTVGVIIETKRPTNKAEMLKKDNLNVKAFHELVLYYLRERITLNNLEIKYLIATNIYEWFIFDASVFEKIFAQNADFVKQFIDFEEKRLSGTSTDFFYREIAARYINSNNSDIECAYFDIRDYEIPLRNSDKTDDSKLIALFKLLSPEHLLKLPFANDSNTLDHGFYSELLYIIGLTETKSDAKKTIERNKAAQRLSASILENAIRQIDSMDKISRLQNPSQYGDNHQDRLFNTALDLTITWVNRILFLKLLEAQLVKYSKGDKNYAFLTLKKIKTFDDLNSLFFSVLAKLPKDRHESVKDLFHKVPYLNSSLFELTELEHSCIVISNLSDDELPLFKSTVLKDSGGNRKTGKLPIINYLFEFLDAYDFASEGSEEIQEDNKSLINASVLGLIFEKINGYKDGSFFTPGFITMYMCRETIRRAVIQKFNDTKGWHCDNFDQLYDKIDDRAEANSIVNSLKICDPAVGSGHFLVSALNELIAIKSDLRILSDRNGQRLKEYAVEVANDELIIIDDDGQIFEYAPNNKESQRVQEALFHEKQTIIENCLFGVDINPNSVKICRLRLWIELLKNSYYIENTDEVRAQRALETLPNIDINIKCGNSLVSRYALDADIKQALKKSKWTIDSYKIAVMSYRNANSKDEKREMEHLISQIKNDFESEVKTNDKRLIKLNKLKAELLTLTTQTSLFALSKLEKARWDKEVKSKATEIRKLENELEEIKNNRIYENAFEWRFEFPEALNDDGEFIGFDAIIGNPPYISSKDLKEKAPYLSYESAKDQFDLYSLFIELSIILLKTNGINSLIVPDSFLARSSFMWVRKYLYNNSNLYRIAQLDQVFSEANVSSCMYFAIKSENLKNKIEFIKTQTYKTWLDNEVNIKMINYLTDDRINSYRLVFINDFEFAIIRKMFEFEPLTNICVMWRGEEIGKASSLITSKYDSESIRILQGENIAKFTLKGKSVFINKVEIKKDITRYAQEKIVIRQLGKNINAALSVDGEISLQSVYCLYSTKPNYNNKFILAIINSELINFLYNSLFSEKQTFPRILLENLKKIPIPKISLKDQEIFITLVDQVIKRKSEDPNADTKALELEIDRLVYELYGLNDDEIKIVESSKV